MSSISDLLNSLNTSIDAANASLSKRGLTVAVINEKIQPKEPVYLQIKHSNGEFRPIGITHLVHLKGENWDAKPFETIARSTEEITRAILDRIALFFDAEKKGLYIDENGTIFHFNHTDIVIHEDKTFSFHGKVVTFAGKQLPLTRIKSESIVEFRQLKNGDLELFDSIDRRVGKGIFINTNGEVYRA